MYHPPPRTSHRSGFTLIELLVGLGLLLVLVAGITTILPRGTQVARTSTLAAGSNQTLTRTGEQLALEISSGQTILQQASATRLDMLKVTNRLPLDGSRPAGAQEVTAGAGFDALVGSDVILATTQGDYMLARVESSTAVTGGKRRVRFDCGIYLPGNVAAYPYKSVSLAFASATGESANSHATSLYRRVSSWAPVDSGLTDVRFAPVYSDASGRANGDFGAALAAPLARQGNRDLTGINYALTSTGERRVNTAGTASVRLLGTTPWACGAAPGMPARNNGKLQVNVLLDGQRPTGPAGVPAVASSGPGFSTTLNTWAVRAFENLPAGLYNVTASSFGYMGSTYDATVTGSPASIGNGRDATININYTIRRGTAVVTITGLPGSTTAPVTFTGAETKTVDLPVGVHRVDLKPGTYTVSAPGVGGMNATVSPTSLTINSGIDRSVSIAYAYPNGDLQVRVAGLPAGVQGGIHLRGLSNRDVNLANGTAMFSLPSGTYTITADPVPGYTAAVSPGSLTLAPRGSAAVTVTYTPITGTIRVTVQGLPAGMTTTLNWTGPETGTRATGSGVITLSGLTPGTYTFSGAMTAGYTSSPKAVTLAAAATVDVDITFVAPPPPTGTLQIAVKGLPAGVSTTASWTGASSGSRVVGNGTITLSGVPAGAYTVNGTGVGTYSAPAVTVNVPANGSALASLDFATAPGFVEVTVKGLPAGQATTVSWTGTANGSRTMGNGTFTLSNVLVGTLTLAGSTAGAYTAPARSVTVVSGSTTSVELNFTAPPPSPSSLTIQVYSLRNQTTTIRWTGPQSGSQVVTGDTRFVLNNVRPGTYTISGDRVGTYFANNVTVTVIDGGNPTTFITFTNGSLDTPGSVRLHVSGLPDGALAQINMASMVFASNVSFSMGNGMKTLQNLPSTMWIISPQAVAGFGAHPQMIVVPRGNTPDVFIRYSTTARLVISVQGLPGGDTGRISWSGGPSAGERTVGNGMLDMTLVPGTYNISGATSGAGYVTYMGQSKTLKPGDLVRITLQYYPPAAVVDNPPRVYYANAAGEPLTVDEWMDLPEGERYYVSGTDPKCTTSGCPSPTPYDGTQIVTEPPCANRGDCKAP